MPLAADYPFLDVLWTMVIFFAFIIWIWLLITVFADIFRRRDIGGGMKAVWIIFVILLPYLGVLIYLIAEHQGMADRNAAQMQQVKEQQDAYIKSVAGSSRDRPDRAGEAAARQRRDLAGRVRQHQVEGARLVALAASRGRGDGRRDRATTMLRHGRDDPDRLRRHRGRRPRARAGDRGGKELRRPARRPRREGHAVRPRRAAELRRPHRRGTDDPARRAARAGGDLREGRAPGSTRSESRQTTSGQPATSSEKITSAARDRGARLVVLGAHHHGFFGRLIGTDVAAQVERELGDTGTDIVVVD